jgi:hypothetical protein
MVSDRIRTLAGGTYENAWGTKLPAERTNDGSRLLHATTAKGDWDVRVRGRM